MVVVRVRGRRATFLMVDVMVPMVGTRRVRALLVVATQRKRLATQSAHGQQGRDQEGCEEASDSRSHAGTLSPRASGCKSPITHAR